MVLVHSHATEHNESTLVGYAGMSRVLYGQKIRRNKHMAWSDALVIIVCVIVAGAFFITLILKD